MVEALLLGLVAFIAQSEYALGTSLISRPIVTGLLTGLVLGDMETGIVMGATLELAFIGSFSVGASLPPDVVTGGILGVAFAINSGAGAETALLLGLPIATLALIVKNIYNGMFIPLLCHKADAYAEVGDTRGIERMHLISGIGLSLMLGIIVTVSYLAGVNMVKGFLDAIPEFIKHGLSVATGIIPALGFAMLARLLINKKVAPYFFLGFVLMAYLKIPVTGIAILGAIVAVVMVNMPKFAASNRHLRKERLMTMKMISDKDRQQAETTGLVTARDLRRVFWRSFQMEFSWNYERQMNLAFVYTLIPVLKKLYSRKEDLAEALKRHLAFFNTTPHIVTLILGITVAMEEKNSQQKEMDASSIDNVKASLMGPLAGIGDSFFWGTLRLIATGIGTSLALKGNILGPILFLLVFNVPHILARWFFTRWGYVLGTGVLQRIQQSGMMESLTYGASIIGLMVVGAMTASMIDITIPITFGTGEAKTHVQDIINDIMPCLLPLISFAIVYWLLGKKVKPLTIIGGIALVGIFGSWIGLF